MSSRPTWELRKTLSQNKVKKGEYGLVVEGRLGMSKALGSISSAEKKSNAQKRGGEKRRQIVSVQLPKCLQDVQSCVAYIHKGNKVSKQPMLHLQRRKGPAMKD